MQYSPYEVRQSDRLESHHGVRKVLVVPLPIEEGQMAKCV